VGTVWQHDLTFFSPSSHLSLGTLPCLNKNKTFTRHAFLGAEEQRGEVTHLQGTTYAWVPWPIPISVHKRRGAVEVPFTMLFLVTAAACSSCTRQPPPERAVVAEPLLTHHFKKVHPPIIAAESPSLEYTFPVKNCSDRIVAFKGLRPSCNCSVAALDAWTLEPGEATNLRVSLNLTGRSLFMPG